MVHPPAPLLPKKRCCQVAFWEDWKVSISNPNHWSPQGVGLDPGSGGPKLPARLRTSDEPMCQWGHGPSPNRCPVTKQRISGGCRQICLFLNRVLLTLTCIADISFLLGRTEEPQFLPNKKRCAGDAPQPCPPGKQRASLSSLALTLLPCLEGEERSGVCQYLGH